MDSQGTTTAAIEGDEVVQATPTRRLDKKESSPEASVRPPTVRLRLVSFGWTFGPERRRSSHNNKGHGRQREEGGNRRRDGGSTEWAAALNLRKFANPPAAMRRRGLTGLDRELQTAVWAQPKADALYAGVLADVQRLLVDGVMAAMARKDGEVEEEEEEESSSDEESATTSTSSGNEEADEEEKLDEDSDDDDDDDDDEDDSQEDSDDQGADPETCEGSDEVNITIGLGCEKGKHRSVAVVERLQREACLQSVSITVDGHAYAIPVEVSVHHRDLHKTGKDAQRGFKSRQHADQRQRKRGRGHAEESW